MAEKGGGGTGVVGGWAGVVLIVVCQESSELAPSWRVCKLRTHLWCTTASRWWRWIHGQKRIALLGIQDGRYSLVLTSLIRSPQRFMTHFADSSWKLHPPLTGKVDNFNSPAGLQRITVSIRKKLCYLGGTPSVAMSEIPPGLEEWLTAEEAAAEAEANVSPSMSVGVSAHLTCKRSTENKFYAGDDDVDGDEEVDTTHGAGDGGEGEGEGGDETPARRTPSRHARRSRCGGRRGRAVHPRWHLSPRRKVRGRRGRRLRRMSKRPKR